jgi:hypothetical protein
VAVISAPPEPTAEAPVGAARGALAEPEPAPPGPSAPEPAVLSGEQVEQAPEAPVVASLDVGPAPFKAAAAPVVSAPLPSPEVRKSGPNPEPKELDPAAADEGRSRSTLAAWAVACLGLFAAAFFAERLLEPQASPKSVESFGARRAVPVSSPPPLIPRAEKSIAVPIPSAPTSEAPPSGPAWRGIKIYNGILEPALITAPTDGLLVVESTALLKSAQLAVDGKQMGEPPIKVALSQGTHEVAVTRGDAVIYRYVSVRAGKTMVLREP